MPGSLVSTTNNGYGCRFIRLHYTPPLPTDQSVEKEADMLKMMYLIVKRQWHQQEATMKSFFGMCGHKEDYLKEQVSYQTCSRK